MAREHPLPAGKDIDLGRLADELIDRLGVGESVQAGHGALWVRDRWSNAADVDPVVVQDVIAAHVPPTVVSPRERLITDVEAAVTVEDLKAALLRWARAAGGSGVAG